jgi:hypothetical protein
MDTGRVLDARNCICNNAFFGEIWVCYIHKMMPDEEIGVIGKKPWGVSSMYA